MRIIGNNPAAENAVITAIASGTLPSGQPVVVNADGTVSVIAETSATQAIGSVTDIQNDRGLFVCATYDSNSNKVVVAYAGDNNGTNGKAIVGTVSGTSISFGTAGQFASGILSQSIGIAFDSSNNKVVVAYKHQADQNYGKAAVGTVSGTNISFGTPVVFNSAITIYPTAAFDPSSGKVVIVYADYGNSTNGTAIVGTVSGTSISFGSEAVFNTGSVTRLTIVADTTNDKVVIAYKVGSAGKSVVGTVSGTSISFGTESTFVSAANYQKTSCFDSDTNKVFIAYRTDGGSNSAGVVGTVSGTDVTFGTPVVFSTNSTAELACCYNTAAKKVIITYEDATDSQKLKIVEGTISGAAVSFGSAIDSGSTSEISTPGIVFDPTESVSVVAFRDVSDTRSFVFQSAYTSTNITAENFIGMSRGAVTSTSYSESLGSSVELKASSSLYFSATYDSNSKKVILVYGDAANSAYGTAVVGTISGTSVSFGTPVVFVSGEVKGPNSVVFDSSRNVIVVSFIPKTTSSANDRIGRSITGAVSGTTINFNTAATFHNAVTQDVASVFDPSTNKVLVVYKDASGSNDGSANVGTLSASGDSISFGSQVDFTTNTTSGISIAADTTNDRVVISYHDSSSSVGKAVVGTISGTSVSFGTPVTFNSGNVYTTSTSFDSDTGKVVISYRDNGNSDYGTAIVGTIDSSDNSISFGTEAVFESASVTSMSMAYNSAAQKTIISYRDGGDSNKVKIIEATVSGTAISFGSVVDTTTVSSANNFKVAFDSTENVIFLPLKDDAVDHTDAYVFRSAYTQITRDQVASGSPATIDIGSAVSANQLSLTAGQQYFVQTDGTIGLTADDPSVIAGTAVSAADIIVKG